MPPTAVFRGLNWYAVSGGGDPRGKKEAQSKKYDRDADRAGNDGGNSP